MKKEIKHLVQLAKKVINGKANQRFYLIVITCCLLFGAAGFVLVLNQRQNIATRAAALVNCDISSDKIAMDSEEQAFLTIINNYRKEQNNVDNKNRAELKISYTLTQAAAWQSNYQATNNTLSHNDNPPDDVGPGGRKAGARMENCGYIGNGTAENVLYGNTNAQEAFITWKNSSGHNTNMLRPEAKVIGIARQSNGSGPMYWTTDFGYTDDTNGQPGIPNLTTGSTSGPSSGPSVTSSPQPTAPIATVFGCLGCQPPVLTPTIPPPGTQASPNPMSNPTSTINPCTSGTKLQGYTTTNAYHRKKGGSFSNQFIQFLTQLLQLLMQFLGINSSQISQLIITQPAPNTQSINPTTSPCI